MSGLYLHLPFCQKKCAYCSFNSVDDHSELAQEYLAALTLEIQGRSRSIPPLKSIYFGGGTPSLFSPPQIEALLNQCLKNFTVTESLEITLEANPNTVNSEKLAGYRRLGINRLSLGAQSLNPVHLATLGRLHTVEQIYATVESARQAGFDNLSLDLIFGIPGQTAAGFRKELLQLIKLAPEHVSLYNLTLEEGAPLYEQIRQGKLSPPPEEAEARMYQSARELLAGAGFEHYEISNFAVPSRRCRHNLNYWLSGEYLGLGAGAYSYLNGKRWANTGHILQYIHVLKAGGKPIGEEEEISDQIAIKEWLMLRLRMLDGLCAAEFEQRFGQSLSRIFSPQIKRLSEQNLIVWDGRQLRINPENLFVSNEILLVFQ